MNDMEKFEEILKRIDKISVSVKKLEERVTKLEGKRELKKPTVGDLDIIGSKLQGKVDKLGQQKLIIIALRHKPKQSKSDLLNILLKWGIKKTIHKWFRGSNFKHRLLDTGIIMKDGTNSNGEDLYSLTITKGTPNADKLIQNHNLQ